VPAGRRPRDAEAHKQHHTNRRDQPDAKRHGREFPPRADVIRSSVVREDREVFPAMSGTHAIDGPRAMGQHCVSEKGEETPVRTGLAYNARHPARRLACVAAVLGLASSGGTLARGEEMLVAYSLGLGVPFVLTGLALGRLSGALALARRHSRSVSAASGLVLAALGVLLITGEVGVVSSWSSSLLHDVGLGTLATG